MKFPAVAVALRERVKGIKGRGKGESNGLTLSIQQAKSLNKVYKRGHTGHCCCMAWPASVDQRVTLSIGNWPVRLLLAAPSHLKLQHFMVLVAFRVPAIISY